MQITNQMSKQLCFQMKKENVFVDFNGKKIKLLKVDLEQYKNKLLSIIFGVMYDCIFNLQYDLKIGQELLDKYYFLRNEIKLINYQDEKLLQDVLDFYNKYQ